MQDLQSRKLGRPSQGQLMFDVLPIGAPVALPLLIQCEVAGRGRIDWLRYAVRCCDFEKYTRRLVTVCCSLLRFRKV